MHSVKYSLQFQKCAHFLTLFWAVLLAIYWVIISSMLANLYQRYCDDLEDRGSGCDNDDKKFITLPVMGFLCMGTWVSWQ